LTLTTREEGDFNLNIGQEGSEEVDEVTTAVYKIVIRQIRRRRLVRRDALQGELGKPRSTREVRNSSRTARPVSTGLAWANRPILTRRKKNV
jgi:hypothetical protein